MRLAELCDIHSGYTARGRLEPLREGGIPALQLGDIDSDKEALNFPLQRYDLGELADHYFVCGGEVLFRSRGKPNTAVAVGASLPEPAAAIVPLVIIRPDLERVLPEYLAWAINRPDAQRRLSVEAQGTGLRMISIATLENLDIAVPDLLTQRRIAELNTLAKREGLCCQTNSNWSQLWLAPAPSAGTDLPPLLKGGGAVTFEVCAFGQ